VVWRVLGRADEHHLPFLASALTFDALLAAVPFIALLLVGVTHLAQVIVGATVVPGELFHRLLPAHLTGGSDPFGRIEKVLGRVLERRAAVSLVAVPAFIWFSTRLFAAVRISLDAMFEVVPRTRKGRAVVFGFLLTKARDSGMVLGTLVLFLLNTAVTTLVSLAQTAGVVSMPWLKVLVTLSGRLALDVLAAFFSFVLFFLVYRYGSVKVLARRPAMMAGLFATVGFELAKRVYGLYMAEYAGLQAVARGDADVLTLTLFVLWVYVTASLFLLGGALGAVLEQDAAR
jgi:membrane protein